MMARWNGRQRMWSGGEARGAAIALVIASIAGCSGEGPYDHLADRAEEVRQLQFVKDVPYRTLTPQQFSDEVSQDVDEWTDE